jgi:hypothetical protein
MNERLWSPQMRKWVRDADRHGHPIGLYKTRPSRRDAGIGGSFANPERYTDDGFVRILDTPGNAGYEPRRIDRAVM